MTKEEEQRIEEEFEMMVAALPDDDYGKIIRAVATFGISIEEKEFLLDQGHTADAKVHKIYMWTANTKENIHDILSGRGTISSFTQLPVQIWVILTEMAEYFTGHYQAAVKHFPRLGITAADITNLSAILGRLAAIQGKLAEAELPAIELLRNYYSHLSISKYSIQWNARNKTFSRELDGKSRGQVRREIRAHLDRFDGDIRKISTDLAGRLGADVDDLHDLVEKWSQVGLLV